MSQDTFSGVADGLDHVGDAIETVVYGSVLRASAAIERAKKSYQRAGQEIGLAFSNVKNSIKGVFQQLIGDRLKKFAQSIPIERFQAFGERMKNVGGVAKHFVMDTLGVGKAFDLVGGAVSKVTSPFKNLMGRLKSDRSGVEEVGHDFENLADTVGKDLPQKARSGGEKFKRAGDSIANIEHMIAQGLLMMRDRVDNLDKDLNRSSKSVINFMRGFSLKGLADIGSGLHNVATQGGQLTTSYEAAAQSASVSARKVVASTGIFGKELTIATQKAAGLSMGMKVSEQTAGNAVASMQQFGVELKAFGIDSAETGVKLEDGLGVPIRDLAFNVHKMRDGLKLSDKDLAEVSKSFTATGEAIHDMVHPLQNMPALLELAQRRSNLVAQGMSSIGGKQSIKSINKAIQSLFVLTGDAKGAQEGAVALETKMVESMENFRNMFSGTSKDLDAFLVNTSVVTGDVKNAFRAAEQGPDAFIKEFSKVISKLKKDGKKTSDILSFFGGQMSEALGPDLANTLITALSNADEAKTKMMDGLKDTGRALGAVAKESWRSSMTMQESFDLMMGAAESRFRSIGRAAAVTFIHDTGKAFDKFNDQAEALVKQGGPLGKMVEKMSEISSLGAKALLPKALQPIAAIFGHLSPEIFQAVSAFASLLPVLLSLGGPAGILLAVGAGIAGIYLGFKQVEAHLKHIGPDWKKATDEVNKYQKQLKGLQEGTDKYREVSEKLAAAKQAVAALEPIKKLNDERDATDKVVASAQKRMKQLQHSKDSYDALTFKLKKMREEQDRLAKGPQTAGTAKQEAANKKAIAAAEAKLKTLQKSKDEYDKQTKVVQDAGKKQAAIEQQFSDASKARLRKEMMDKVTEVTKQVGDFLEQLPDILGTVWDVISPVLGKLIDKFGDWVVKSLGNLIGPVVFAIDDAFQNAWAKFRKWIGDAWTNLEYDVSGYINGIVTKIGVIWATVTKPFQIFFDWIVQTVDELFGHSTIPELFQRGFDTIASGIQNLWGIVKGIFDDMMTMAGRVFEPIGKIVDKIFGHGSDSVPKQVGLGMDQTVQTMTEATNTVKQLVQKAFYDAVTDGLVGAFTDSFKAISTDSTKFFKSELDAFHDFLMKVQDMFRQTWLYILSVTQDAVDEGIRSSIQTALKDLSALQSAMENLRNTKAEVEKAKADQAKQDAGEKKPNVPMSTTEEITEGMKQWYINVFRDDFMGQTDRIAKAVMDLQVIKVPSNNGAAANAANRIRGLPTPFGPNVPGTGMQPNRP